MHSKILKIINTVLDNKDDKKLSKINDSDDLRKDYGFDSFDLAELTVIIEKEFGIDIFEDGMVSKVNEIIAKLKK